MAAPVQQIQGRGARHLGTEAAGQRENHTMGTDFDTVPTARAGEEELELIEGERRTNPAPRLRLEPGFGTLDGQLRRLARTPGEKCPPVLVHG